jgi:hypothetical protein
MEVAESSCWDLSHRQHLIVGKYKECSKINYHIWVRSLCIGRPVHDLKLATESRQLGDKYAPTRGYSYRDVLRFI